jgi:hypothetical protein
MTLFRGPVRNFKVLLLGFLVVILIPAVASPYTRVLKNPELPVFISIEQKKYEKGKISRAWLRTDTDTERLPLIENMVLLDRSDCLSKDLDSDKIPDPVWKLFLRSKEGKEFSLWCVTLSGSGKGWLFLLPWAKTLWDEIPFRIDIPENILLYISPSLPAYRDTEQGKDSKVLSFLYTLMVTPEGPRFVLSPETYSKVNQIASMVTATEKDPLKNKIYRQVLGDYSRMAQGKMPSSPAVLNLELEVITDFELK